MFTLITVINIFVYVCVVCPLLNVECHTRGKYGRYVDEDAHTHSTEPPCSICPRNGICVPRIQCPAHVRPGSKNPLCHLDGTEDIGVCCFTGNQHAAESDKIVRKSSITSEDMKSAHQRSRQKMEQLLSTADNLVDNLSIVNVSSPSYRHYLSTFTDDERARELAHGALLNLFTTQELKARQAISEEELTFGLTDHTDGPFCPPRPNCPKNSSRYRTVGGECNNRLNPNWGAANTAFERLLPPDYSDGIWAMRTSLIGLPLPSARSVSLNLLLDASHPSEAHNLMFMQFGQFIAHDISAGVVFTNRDNTPISCCSGDGEEPLPEHLRHWACAPIEIPSDDPFYSRFRHRCINFVRAQLAPADDCSVGYAKQMNGVTHYPDLSHLYGGTSAKLASLRAESGLLKVLNDYGRDLPPTTDGKDCLAEKDGAACFDSGDNHANQILSLTALHTIWTREHNRVAKILTRLNPIWTDETVFQETRRILQAEFQHIIYNEWLPLLLGPQIMQLFHLCPSTGYSSWYNPQVNPSLTAEFSTAAMRFGHSIVDGKIMIPSTKSSDMYETISIPEIMFQPSRLRLVPFLDRLLAGLSMQPMQSVDPFITEGLSHYMFRGVNPYGLDLAAINVQRGRDYGLRSYNHYRRLCGLEPFVDFNQYSPIAAKRLSSVYQSPEDVDLWIGGLLEVPVEGGIVGSTFAQIIGDQFARLKTGDRYFYENGPDVNPGAFTPGQLAEIKKVKFSRLLCDNRDGIEIFTQSPNAFLRTDLPGNEPVPCDSPLIPTMDLTKFRQF